MNSLPARWHTPLILLLWLLPPLLLLAPALRPGYVLLAANLPCLLDPLWQPLTPPHALATANPVLGDQFYQFHPWQVTAWEMLSRGEWPTWNPWINGGQPLYGNGLAGILSPFNLVSRLFPADFTQVVSALLRLWVAGGGTYLYSRTIGLSRPAASLAMLTFALSGPLVGWLWGTPSHTLAWLPVLLWTGERLLTTRTLRWALVAAGALALLIFSAQPEMAFQIGLFWGAYLVCRAWWLEGTLGLALRRHFPWWLLVMVLGVGLAAVEVLGFLDALRHSTILHHRQAASLPTLRDIFFSWQEWPTLVTTLLPRFLGREADESYWYPIGNSVENNAYAGVLPLLLALLALWTSRHLPDRPVDRTVRRWIWLWGGLGIVMLALAVALPLFAGFAHLPPLNLTLLSRLRGPYTFAIAILAGFGFELLLTQQATRRPFAWLLIAAALLNALLVAVAYLGFTRFADQLIASGRAFMEANVGSPALDRPLDELYALVETRHLAKLAMLHPSNPIMYLPLLVAGSVLLLFWVQRHGRLSLRWYAPVLITLVWADLWWTGAGSNTVAPTAWLDATPPAVTFLQSQAEPFRVVGTNLVLNPNMSMLTQLEDVRGYDALATNRYRDLLAGLDGFAPSGYHNYFRHLDDPRLDRVNAVYGLSRTPPSNPSWTATFTDPSGVTVYRNSTALPRAYLVYAAEVVATPTESLARTLDPAFDAANRVVLEAMPSNWTPPADAPISAPPVEFSARRATSVQLQTISPSPAILVLLDSYTPGWRATIDQQPTPVYVANHAFRAVVVPAGRHTVTFTYAPPMLTTGAFISLASALAVLGILFWLRYTKHNRANPMQGHQP